MGYGCKQLQLLDILYYYNQVMDKEPKNLYKFFQKATKPDEPHIIIHSTIHPINGGIAVHPLVGSAAGFLSPRGALLETVAELP
jgi:hypothetical protein